MRSHAEIESPREILFVGETLIDVVIDESVTTPGYRAEVNATSRSALARPGSAEPPSAAIVAISAEVSGTPKA
jgi:hypothetical protein